MANQSDSSPRKIKRIQTSIDDQTKITQAYKFFQQIIASSILLLKNEKDKLNYSSWLIRLNNEPKNDKILDLLKILCISIKNNHSYYIFTEPPPENLDDFNLNYDYTVEKIEYLRITTIEENNKIPMDESTLQNSKSKRSAAVSPDMLSYSLSKTSHYIVQSFYARSDFPIYTWYNPESIQVPTNIDHNDWELYLTRFNMISQNKNKNKNQATNTCQDIMKLDQVSKEVAFKFNWHPYSILFTSNRPRKSAAFFDTDAFVLNQPIIQQQIDEAAFAIVHNKSFPGLKMLNPKVYFNAMMPDPTYVFKMTGVRMKYYAISPGSFKSCTRQWIRVEVREEPKSICSTQNQNCSQKAIESGCKKDDKTVQKQNCSFAVKPAEAQMPCKRVTTLSVTDFQDSSIKDDSIAREKPIIIKGENDSECLKAKKTNNERDKGLCKPKCPNTSSKPVCKQKLECKPNVSDSNNNNNCSTRKRCVSANPDKSFNDTSNYDWTRFSDEISADIKWEPTFNSTRKNMHKSSNRSHVHRENDQLASVEHANRNAQPNNQTCSSTAKNSRTAESTSINRSSRCHKTQERDEQLRCNRTANNSLKADRSRNENCTYASSKYESSGRNECPRRGTSSYDDLSDFSAALSDERSYKSQWSEEIEFPPSCRPDAGNFKCPTTSISYSAGRRTRCASESDCRGRANTTTKDHSKSKCSKYNNSKCNRPANATCCIERDIARNVDDCDVIENDWNDNNRDCYIEDVSMPHMSFNSYEESQSRGFPECEYRGNIEDTSMPQMDYETSYSSDDLTCNKGEISDRGNSDTC